MAIGHAASLLVAGLVVAAAVGTALLLRTTLAPAEPPPLPVPASADAQAAAAPVAAPPAPAGAALAAREAIAAGATVAGTLRLDQGQPLGGWRVRLQRVDRHPLPAGLLDTGASRPAYAAVDLTTAADGTFTFPGLDAGRYEVRCVGQDDVMSRVSLAAHERREIELVATGAVVTCRVLHAGAPLGGTWLRIEGQGRSTTVGTDDAGVVRCLLPPGLHEVRIFGTQARQRPTSVHALRVPADLAAMAIAFEAGGVDLDVDVQFAAGGVPDQFLVRLDGETDDHGRPTECTASGRNGRATLLRVPPGRWCATVVSPALVPVPPREFVAENGLPRASMSFVVAPATSVGLVVLKAGQPLTVAPSAMPSLVAGDVVLPCEAQAGPPKLVYRSVPAGPALLRVEDRVQGDEQVFLPFDPLPARTLDVVLGASHEIVLDVEPRAFVDVRGCDRTGREDFTAVVRVFAGERPVRKQPDFKLYRWASFLPPGDYRVVVERRGVVQEQPLHVERNNVLLRLRP